MSPLILAMQFYPHERVFTDSPVELLGLTAIIALLVSGMVTLNRHWKATRCHIDGCHKHQWKEHTEPDGTKWVLCKPHHPLGGHKLTHAAVLEGHRINVTADR